MIRIPQAGVLAFRIDADGHLELLLITSRKSRRWTIPKGLVGLRFDPRITARVEAHEEAGVSGRLSREPIGTYTYRKWWSKCRVSVYALRVTSQSVDWPERAIRKRKWFDADAAVKAITRKALRRLVKDALASQLMNPGKRSARQLSNASS